MVIAMRTLVCGYKGYLISAYLLAYSHGGLWLYERIPDFRHGSYFVTPVCSYKGFRISAYLKDTAVFGYKGWRISVYLIATVVCGYKGYQIHYQKYGTRWRRTCAL